ncbi:hypothetical protein CFO_g3643 [Ceratocystis platani]|uniref:Sensitive to high expression protein 9, mitochondrial n=1 Tax=Ceratocystis fimbriata f. sp. platani TaxID=88771 RepID=A0A0F8BNA1_CERFI|nr:hypothetical protein CFO_g3643 [Ceratocystis platani]
MHALLRPGFRLSLGAIRAANGSSGMQPSRIASSATRAQLARSAVCMRLYSSQKPPSDSDFDIENSPFAHLLKKPAKSPASSETPATPPATPTDAATADNSNPKATASSQPTTSYEPQNASSPTPSSSSTASSSDDSTSLPFNKDQIHRNLQDTRKVLSERFSVFMDNVQSRVVHASETLNVLTGYTPIEAIKMANAQLEKSLAEAQSQVRACRTQYKTMHARRAATQREVTTLLARKDAWSPTDLERFTQLYRTDHEMESQVSQASESLTEAEAEEQSLSTRLNQGILRRYHEEQIWSDRIRRASTWGTWGLMGVNILLFLGLQFIAEPWKRNRLVKGVVAEEKAVLEEVRDRLDHVMKTMEENLATAHALAYPPTPAPVAEAVPEAAPERATLAQESNGDDTVIADEPSENQRPLSPSYTTSGPIQLYFPMPANVDWSWEEFLRSPKLWRNLAEDFYSDRRIDMRMRDSATLVLEGMAVGTVITAAVTALVMGAGTGFPWNLLAVFT